MKTIETNYYTIDEHPNPSEVFDWIRDNWYDLGQPTVDEVLDSLKVFAKSEGLTLDCSISIIPDRGEFIRFGNVPSDFTMPKSDGNCQYTGVCWDECILSADTLGDVEYEVLKTLHAEGEYIYSDEGLRELCESMEYYFDASGAIE